VASLEVFLFFSLANFINFMKNVIISLFTMGVAAAPTSDYETDSGVEGDSIPFALRQNQNWESLMRGQILNSDTENEEDYDEQKAKSTSMAPVAKRRRLNPRVNPVVSQEYTRLITPLPNQSNFKSCSKFGKASPSCLISLAYPNARTTVLDVWNVWVKRLSSGPLDDFHQDLASKAYYMGWEGKWAAKYRFFEEIGDEIERRMKRRMNAGKSVLEIINRLDTIRRNMTTCPTIQGLVDGLRVARGDDPYIHRKMKIDLYEDLKVWDKELDEEWGIIEG
jgi:hypothetical protein